MKTTIVAAVLCALVPGIALAGPCDQDIKKVDAEIKKGDLPPDERAQIKDMRNQAADLCKAGNQQEGLDVLTEAKAMLNIE